MIVKAKPGIRKQLSSVRNPRHEVVAAAVVAEVKARPRQGRPDVAVVASRPRARRELNAASSRVNRRAHQRLRSKRAASKVEKPRKRRKPEHPQKIQKSNQVITSREVVAAGADVVVEDPANRARQKHSRVKNHRASL